MIIQPPIEPTAKPSVEISPTPDEKESDLSVVEQSDFCCPKCGVKFALTPALMRSPQPVTVFRCSGCGEKLRPEFSPEKGLLTFGAFAANLVLLFIVSPLTEHSGPGRSSFKGLGLLAVLLFNVFVLMFARFKIEAHCLRGLKIADKDSTAPQFSLLDAVYGLLFIGVLIGYVTQPRHEAWQVMLGGYLMWGIIEVARYVSLKRAQDSKTLNP